MEADGAGMSRRHFNRLLNHRAIHYRNVPTVGQFNEPTANWTTTAVPDGYNCRPNQNWSGTLQDNGPGIQQGAMRQWFLRREMDVEETDILHIIEGPEAPLYLRIESVARPGARRGVHHIEVNVEIWPGDPADLEAS